MYTYVYKCLTAHNTIIHSEQVDWIMDAPLGQMLESTDLAKKGGKPTSSRLAIDDVHIESAESAECGTEGGTLVKLPKAKKAPKEPGSQQDPSSGEGENHMGPRRLTGLRSDSVSQVRALAQKGRLARVLQEVRASLVGRVPARSGVVPTPELGGEHRISHRVELNAREGSRQVIELLAT